MIGETLLDRYTVQELVGEGGMGIVYRARDPQGRVVGIKRLHGDVATSPELVARFQREAAAQGMLEHPNIAALHAVGITDDAGLFLVMELVEGAGLADLLYEGALAPPRALAICNQILSALHYAHQFGMVHRDLKPENVLIAAPSAPGGAETAKVIDFGLVKLLNDVLGPDECQRLTATGMVFGTPQYMSPEQIMGAPVDARSDLYALGVLLFEMLTGRRPFEHEEVSDLWQAHLHAPVPTLASHDPRLGDPGLESIVSALLAKRPDDRFQTAHAAARALRSIAL